MTRALILSLFLFATHAAAETMKMAVTTSFHNSGLSDVLLPAIRQDTGLDVQLLVVGTGQALRLGRSGDVDAILVHAREAEEAFVAEGFAPYRRPIMYNDFVFIGPQTDAAGVSEATSATDALQRIAAGKVPFVSRGDESGTHKKEVSLWRAAGIDPATFDNWYKAVGSGMGASLNTATALDAYILADRASWLNFGNKGSLKLLYSGDPDLFNQYAYLPVSPQMHPHVNENAQKRLEDWLISPRAETLINGYRIAGEQLFVFNAAR